MSDLSTAYLGLDLRSPLVASSSPLTGRMRTLVELEEAGVGAVVLPSLFEEQLVSDASTVEDLVTLGVDWHAEASGFFPPLAAYNEGPSGYLNLLEMAKSTLSIPVIASINGVTAERLQRYARSVASAGADGLELNLYFVAADPAHSAADVEARYVESVAAVCEAVPIPVAVKVGPFFSAFANIARAFAGAGARGLVLFNRFYQPDIDVDAFEVRPHLVLSSPEELRLRLRWIAILRRQLDVSLACTGGVHHPSDLVKALLAGADVAMVASSVLRAGPGHAGGLLHGLRHWMADHEYTSVGQMRGAMAQGAVPDPEAYERAAYIRELASWP